MLMDELLSNLAELPGDSATNFYQGTKPLVDMINWHVSTGRLTQSQGEEILLLAMAIRHKFTESLKKNSAAPQTPAQPSSDAGSASDT